MSRIMLIEADQLVAKNLKAYLKKAGHQLEWQVSPQAAMDALEKQLPDLLILDLLLAERSGIEFLYEFRSYPDWQTLPVVVFSSLPEEELGEAAQDALQQLGVAAYHRKSQTSLAELAESLEQILKPVPV